MALRRSLATILLALACSLAQATDLASFELHGREAAPSARPKSYGLHGAMRLSGTLGWAIDNATGAAGFGIERLDNDALSGTSYPLMLALFVTPAPLVPGQGFTYWILDRDLEPGLAYNYYRSNIVHAGPILSSAPDGTYYLHVGVFEQEPGCASSNGYCIDDWFTFSDRLTVVQGVWATADGGAGPPAGATASAVEYFNAGFGHYFVTADPDEIAGLDAGAYNFAFQRTGQQWKVYTSGNAADVCRFFTAPGTFGAKSSHFYTANASECAGLKSNPAWIYEKIAGKVALPAAGACPTGHQLLYRLYNNGQTGAPNHRYTTSLAIRAQMIAQGFVPEDPNTVCVPL